MAAQDASTIPETAERPVPTKDHETITTDLGQEGRSGAGRAEDGGRGEGKQESGEGDARPGVETTVTEGKAEGHVVAASEHSALQEKDDSQGGKPVDNTSPTPAEPSQHDVQFDPSAAHTSPRKDQAALPTPDEQRETEPAPFANMLKPTSLHASSTINRTASPAYSQSSVTSNKDSVASPSLVSTAPKKFSTVNINKKFLGKTGTGAAPQGPASGASGIKETGLGLMNLSARPSPTLAQQQSASRILTSAKLTSVIPSRASSVTGGLTAAPAAGWAKPAIPSAKNSPIAVNGALSPRTATPVNNASKLAVEPTLGSTAARTPSAQPGSVSTPFGSSGMSSSSASVGIRLTNQGPSAARHLTSLNSVKQPVKRGWQTISSHPDSAPETGIKEIGSGHGPFGQNRFKQSLADDFPTAMEVMEVQRSAVVQAQQAAQAKAAHNQAILEGLNAFRGTNKDPNAHGWDEEDDEDMDFPQVLDFGDGTTYTLPASESRNIENKQQVLPADIQHLQDQHVSKEERFAADDFDRSWPPKAPHSHVNQDKSRFTEHQPSHEQLASTRTLYNARSNKMEPSYERSAQASAEPARPQILPRSAKDATAHPVTQGSERQQPGQQPLERQVSRERPWSRVQPPVIGAERNPWGRRRPSETDHSRTWGPPHMVSESQAWPRANVAARDPSLTSIPHGEERNMHSPPDQPSHLRPLFSQTQNVAAVLSPPTATAEPVSQTTVDITELQKDEMHRAAEQARLRRQQEEAEREAQKERARQKAKELADREAQKEQLKLAMRSEQQASTASILPHTRAEEAVVSSKPPTKEIVARTDVPQHAIARPPQTQTLGLRRVSEKRVAFEEPVSDAQVQRMEPAHRTSFAVPGTTPSIRSSPSDVRRDSELSPTLSTSARSPSGLASSTNQPFSAFFDPLAESSHLPPTELHYNDLSSLSKEDRIGEHAERSKLVIAGVSDRFNLRPELLQAESWRKSTRGQEVVVPGVIGSSREQRVSPKVLLSKPFRQPTPDTPQTMEELVLSPPGLLRVVLPPLQTPRPQSHDTIVGSAFDTVLARLQNAMSTPNDHQRSGAQAETDFDFDTAKTIPVADLVEPHLELDRRQLFSVLPRPEDFISSSIHLPPSPGPAWKRYTIRLPKTSAAQKPYPARVADVRNASIVPEGWILTWDPPLEQLGSRNLSRDDWLMPKSYHRGKLVTTVKMPMGQFQRYIPPRDTTRPGESSSVTSQALKEDSHKPGQRKIIVKLPPSNSGAHGSAANHSTTALSVREEFQTSSEIPLLSPMSSLEDLPSSVPGDFNVQDGGASHRRAQRKVPEGVAIAFARPHGGSFSEDADAKSSVQFMVSSEIEDDNLLSEVNKMSMDGLTDNPAAEELQMLGLETEPRTSSTPSTHPHTTPGAKSVPPSPSKGTNSAWSASGTYPGAQSPGRKLPNRDQLLNVWTHMDGDRSSNQQGNVLRHSEGDVPSGLLSSIQDVKEDGTAETQTARNESDLDLDLPRYPTINAPPSTRESGELGSDINGQHFGSTATIDGDGDHAASAALPRSYDGYQYMAINHMGPSPSHLSSAYSSRSPTDGMSNMVNNANSLNTVSHQHGVWMPLQQASNVPYSSGINAAGSPIYAAVNMSKSPVSSGYDGTPVMANAGLNLGPMSGSMGTSSGGMYSHPSGPLDSPSVPYIRPSGYSSQQPSHLGGMSGMYSQAGPYANSNREMYGVTPQYGHRGNMSQPMLATANHEYGGRYNNPMTMNRPFGGFNGGSPGPIGGSRYNQNMNGFAQSNLQGTQQQRIGLSGHGKMGPSVGRKVW